ncbi:hypothetical protein J3E72DRAFT_181276 [Bipolaris maydis]|nr:hypothetical protein BM1_05173 [Bipolaris maydis]KAJ5052677.1 hypothetical protein J3E74DRAFT_228799 [Bipolaris maydis]KAJ6201209.1 hypothetical protein J3E72DRAFT_181276 [Bipolaris maydis]KAJ6211786.1 hypothetical protein PSV09DRAFT_2187312 [Bipolaris maydis]
MSKEQDKQLEGKVAVVSGSSTGIGAAIAQELAQSGASVIMNYPRPAERQAAQSVLDSLPNQKKGIVVEADLATVDGA